MRPQTDIPHPSSSAVMLQYPHSSPSPPNLPYTAYIAHSPIFPPLVLFSAKNERYGWLGGCHTNAAIPSTLITPRLLSASEHHAPLRITRPVRSILDLDSGSSQLHCRSTADPQQSPPNLRIRTFVSESARDLREREDFQMPGPGSGHSWDAQSLGAGCWLLIRMRVRPCVRILWG